MCSRLRRWPCISHAWRRRCRARRGGRRTGNVPADALPRAPSLAGIPPSFRARRWIEIAPDRQTVTLTIPDGLDTGKALAALHQVVTQTVFCDNKPDVTPKMAGRRRQLVYTAVEPPPPALVLLDRTRRGGRSASGT